MNRPSPLSAIQLWRGRRGRRNAESHWQCNFTQERQFCPDSFSHSRRQAKGVRGIRNRAHITGSQSVWVTFPRPIFGVGELVVVVVSRGVLPSRECRFQTPETSAVDRGRRVVRGSGKAHETDQWPSHLLPEERAKKNTTLCNFTSMLSSATHTQWGPGVIHLGKQSDHNVTWRAEPRARATPARYLWV